MKHIRQEVKNGDDKQPRAVFNRLVNKSENINVYSEIDEYFIYTPNQQYPTAGAGAKGSVKIAKILLHIAHLDL